MYFGSNNGPDINTVLSRIYNLTGTKLNVIKNDDAIRLNCIIKFMKKNNINISKDKILLICHFFDNYKNTKNLDNTFIVCLSSVGMFIMEYMSKKNNYSVNMTTGSKSE